MSAAQSILQELHAEIGGAEALLVRAEGESAAGRVKFRERRGQRPRHMRAPIANLDAMAGFSAPICSAVRSENK